MLDWRRSTTPLPEMIAFIEGNPVYLADPNFRHLIARLTAERDPRLFLSTFEKAFSGPDNPYTVEEFKGGVMNWLRADKLEAAQAIVDMENVELRDAGAEMIAEYLIQRKDFQNAVEWAAVIEDERKGTRLSDLALSKYVGDFRSYHEFQRALELAPEISDRMDVPREIADRREAAERIVDETERKRAVGRLDMAELNWLVSSGELEQARELSAGLAGDRREAARRLIAEAEAKEAEQ